MKQIQNFEASDADCRVSDRVAVLTFLTLNEQNAAVALSIEGLVTLQSRIARELARQPPPFQPASVAETLDALQK